MTKSLERLASRYDPKLPDNARITIPEGNGDLRWLKEMTERSSTGSVETCFVERSKVREILITSDADNESTRAILQEVDALPIFTAGDFLTPAQQVPIDRREEIASIFLDYMEGAIGDTRILLQDILHDVDETLSAALPKPAENTSREELLADDAFEQSVEVQTDYERGRQDGIKHMRQLADDVLARTIADELEIEALKARVEDLKRRLAAKPADDGVHHQSPNTQHPHATKAK